MAEEDKTVELYLSSFSLLPHSPTGILHNSVTLTTCSLERCCHSSTLVFVLVLLLLSLQFLVELSLFQNCSPLFSDLRLTSSVPCIYVCYIFNWFKLPQPRFSCMSSAFCLKKRKLSVMIHFFHSKRVIQPPQSSYFYHFNYVSFVVERMTLITVSCSPRTIVVNRTASHS